jgi:hypothetical protein
MPEWPIEARCAAVSLTLAGVGYLLTIGWLRALATLAVGALIVGLVSDRKG